MRIARLLIAVVSLVAEAVLAQAPSYVIDQLYSNADGSVQFVVLREAAGQSGQQAFTNRTLTATSVHGRTRALRFAYDLPSQATAGSSVLVGSVGFQALGLVAPDFVMPDRFLPVDGGTVTFAASDSVTYPLLPVDGTSARFRNGEERANVAMNFAGATASVPPGPVTVAEFHHPTLDHYFVSPLAPDIDALDSRRIAGWARTGHAFRAWSTAAAVGADASPVCRYYIPPGKGDSHFFSASPSECAQVAQRVQSDPAYAGVVQETPSAFFIRLPDVATGACAAGTIPVYRLWNQRADSNHRYTTDRAERDRMIARGFAPEGYGPDGVAMCAPASGGSSVVKVSNTSPFAPDCTPLNGTPYTNAEVEPYLSINPRDPNHLVAVWQQDRWSNGGARSNLTGVSFDGGLSWERRVVPFSRCAGGTPANGGSFERASDPWVSFAPDGTVHQVALAITGDTFVAGSINAITVSRSTDGGRSWSNPRALIVDGEDYFNDKEAMVADPTDARYVYVSWDRLRRSGGGPTFFARTTDGGATWEAAREIHDPGSSSQTINNIPIVLPDGTLINFFSRLDEVEGRTVATMQLMRSPDKGATFEAPAAIHAQQAIGSYDPENGTPVRDATLIASIAVSRAGHLAVVWQDARFSAGQRDGIAFSRSLDGGRTWSAPVQVNREPRVQAFVPTVAFGDDGTIGVTYYDFRSNSSDASELATDYWLAQSTDGVTWRETRIAGPFDLATAANANGLFVGDYMSLGVRGNQFVPLFGMTNSRNFGNRSDIVVAFVDAQGGVPVEAKREADLTATYRARSAPPLALRGELADRHDTAIRAAMQKRVPGWRSPAEPAPRSHMDR